MNINKKYKESFRPYGINFFLQKIENLLDILYLVGYVLI